MELKGGLYRLNSSVRVDDLREIANKTDYVFYYINGKIVTDGRSFFVALTQTFEWPEYAGINSNATFDIMTEPRYYEPHGKGIILFDDCHNLAKTNLNTFNIVFN